MPKIPGVNHLNAVRALKKAEFRIIRQGKHIVMSDGTHVTVKHPETALLTKHWLYVTTDGGETTEHLYLLHVTRVQRQERAA